MRLPVAIILIVWRNGANATAVEGEGGIPVGDRGLVGDPLDLGHQIPRNGSPAHAGDAAHLQRTRRLLHPAMQRLRQEILQHDRIAHRHRRALRSEIVSHPAVDDDLIGPRYREQAALFIDEIADGQAHGVDADDGRIRNARLPGPAIDQRCHRIREECERGAATERPEHPLRGAVRRWRKQQPPRGESPGPVARRRVADEPEIVERRFDRRPQDVCILRRGSAGPRRVDCGGAASGSDGEQHVGRGHGLSEGRLRGGERRDGEPACHLRGPQREVSEALGRQHLRHPQPPAPRVGGAAA